jgi:hypothetical protein
MPFISSLKSTFGPQSKFFKGPTIITISPAISGVSTFNLSAGQVLTITQEGEYTCSVTPNNSFRASIWGAGGGGAGAGWATSDEGGSGGYASGMMYGLTNFKIIVGEGGYGPVTGPTGDGGFCTIGGGASSSPPPNGSDYQYSGSGGGFSGIFTGHDTIHTTYILENSNYKNASVQNRAVLIAGAGGGGGNTSPAQASCRGGNGGGSSGTGGFRAGTTIPVTAGSQTATGTWDIDSGWDPKHGATLLNYGVPSRMQAGPGTGGTYGAGGGGGYFGGAGTADQPSGRMGGGGGGSGYFNPFFLTSATLTAGTAWNSPGGTGDVNYASPAGQGGLGNRSSASGNRGQAGRVVIKLS